MCVSNVVILSMLIWLVLEMLREEVLLSRQEWESTGRFSAVPSGALPCGEMNSPHQRHPDVSGDETKTDDRLRYSGLRWSQDTIPNWTSSRCANNAAPPTGEAE